MSLGLLGAFVVFAIATLFTPGPNNVMLMTTGLNFGLRRAQPHVWGVTLGFSLMVLVVGLGLGAVFASYPTLYAAIKYAGAAYILYLAWLIARSDTVEESEGKGRPISFFEAAAFQWINPKGWVMVVGAVTTYAAIAAFPFNMIAMSIVFGVFGAASSLAWVLFGTGLRRFLKEPRLLRAFNLVMALLLAASLIPVLF
ncbi:MAG TPA: LysE family translocator [Dongiaceae bacterium]|nr:LysE family translocator [Dongiaceae bacterium]